MYIVSAFALPYTEITMRKGEHAKMKKMFAFLLAAVMLLSLTACGKKNDESAKDGADEVAALKFGLVDNIIDFTLYDEHIQKNHVENNSEIPAVSSADFFVIYPNLTTGVLGLEKGEVATLSLGKSSADYLIARNDKFALTEFPGEEPINKISMLTTDTNTELYDILNGGIKQLKENGILDKLIAEDLNAYITSDPTPKELPKFAGAKTYKIAVTGDRPPMDFVTADGKAAGFNVALLTEIANIAQVNFEIVQVDSEARLTALASGIVDAVFWIATVDCWECDEKLSSAPYGTLITEAYFSEDVTYLTLK
jgi:polar amino acid transport system substrate-binding protein